MEINFKPQPKQHIAFQYLERKDIDTVIYGGSLASGKSWLGCAWLIINCLRYSGSRWFMGRSRLSTLRKSTILTMNSLLKDWGVICSFNNQEFVYKFPNGSEIYCLDFFDYPSDEFNRFSGQEYCGGLLDEGNEVSIKGFNMIKSRLRFKLDHFGITGKILITTNPCPGFIYELVKNPPEGTIFVKATIQDNQFISESYKKSLKNLPIELYNRLVLGNWSFDDDYSLFEYEKLVNSYYNEFFENKDKECYITVDPADTGKDRTVIIVWVGMNAIQKVILEKKEAPEIVTKVKELMSLYKVKITNVIIDSSGVGSGVSGYLHGSVKYYANGSPMNGEKFPNLKAQLYYKFSEKINNMEVNFNWPIDDKEVQEYLVIKKKFNGDIAGIISKNEIIRILGRSNDISDACYLRAYFIFKPHHQIGWSKINTSN